MVALLSATQKVREALKAAKLYGKAALEYGVYHTGNVVDLNVRM